MRAMLSAFTSMSVNVFQPFIATIQPCSRFRQLARQLVHDARTACSHVTPVEGRAYLPDVHDELVLADFLRELAQDVLSELAPRE